MRDDGLVWGTYIHGLFDQPQFRRAWLNGLRRRKGLPPVELALSVFRLASFSLSTRPIWHQSCTSQPGVIGG